MNRAVVWQSVGHRVARETAFLDNVKFLTADYRRLWEALEAIDSLVDSMICEEDAEAILRDISGVVCRALKGDR